MDLELRLNEVKENLKKSLAGGVLEPLTESKPPTSKPPTSKPPRKVPGLQLRLHHEELYQVYSRPWFIVDKLNHILLGSIRIEGNQFKKSFEFQIK